MALVIEDGTGKGTADSYVSVADTDTLYTNRTFESSWTTAWNAASSTNKERALREATRYLDRKFARSWRGIKEDQTNGLDWPRVNAYDDDGYIVGSGTSDWPSELAEATAIVAGKLLAGELELERSATGFIDAVGVSTISIKFAAPTQTVPMEEDVLARLIISSYTIGGGVVVGRRTGL